MFPYRTRFRAYHGPANAKTSIAPASTVFTLVRLRQISIAVAMSPGSYMGLGFPGSSSANRQFQEPSFGYYYTFWKNPRYGALQFIGEYAYLTRAPWYVAPGTPSTAHAHMFFGSMRFTLP